MKILLWIIILVLVAFGIYWFAQDRGPVVTDTTDVNNVGTATTTVPKTVTATYTASGFSPSNVTVKSGDTVRFVNESDTNMWVGSAMHPTHEVYDGTNLQTHCATGATPSFDACRNMTRGQSYSFTFTKKGSWGYHNHSQASHFGRVVVE